MLSKVAVVALTSAAFLGAQKTGPIVKAALSPVPLWPQDGNTSMLPKGQYVFYDPRSGEYVVNYIPSAADSGPKESSVLRFGSHALIDPIVTVAATAIDASNYRYIYSIRNEVYARQSIQDIKMLLPSAGITHCSHSSWKISRGNSKVQDITSPRSALEAFEWTPSMVSQTIAPSNSLGGFVVESNLRPGFTTMSFKGTSQAQQYSSEAVASLPREVRDQLNRVLSGGWDMKTRSVIGPKFPKGTSQTEIAQNFLFGIGSLIQDGEVNSNSPFVESLIDTLSAQLESGDVIPIDASRIAFDKAMPGMETTIANCLRATLAQ